MNNRLRKRYTEVEKDILRIEERLRRVVEEKNDGYELHREWYEGYLHGLREEHEFLWHILEWYKVDLKT